ncbi:MAG: hypothetical protein KF770_09550 [Anaerolineae bacterium]|nr:hypothetical protein [Anaerolineae bacterium]
MQTKTWAMTIILILFCAVSSPPISSKATTTHYTLKTMPYWKALLLVYKNIDSDYTDSQGTTQHLTYTLSETEIADGVFAFRRYAALAHNGSNAEAFVQYDIIYVDRPLTTLTLLGENLWWPSPTDTEPELDAYIPQNYDSVFVLWPQTNFATGQQIPSYWGLGMGTTSWANGATYATVANAESWAWTTPTIGEPWLHEWLHGVSPFYADRGFPMPAGDADGGGSHGYTWDPATGWMAYYRDLMTGNVLDNNQLTGITAVAWQGGSILGNRTRIFADYFDTDSLGNYQQVGAVSWDAANERVQMNSNISTGNKIYAPVSFQRDLIVIGRVYIPQAGIGLYDSVSLALGDGQLGNGQVEYWGTLAYGTILTERNTISIMRNDSWGELYPLTLNSGWYTVKMEVRQAPGIIRLKVWPDNANEPDWQLSRSLDAGWTVEDMGYRHFGLAPTFVDDIYALESPYRVYLPTITR